MTGGCCTEKHFSATAPVLYSWSSTLQWRTSARAKNSETEAFRMALASCSYCRIIRRDKTELSARSFSDCPFSCQSRMLRPFALSRFPDLLLDGP